MGEAKRRFHAAGEFGGARLARARGLIFPHLVNNDGNYISGRQIPEDEYQSAILYWDKIACPTTNLVHVGLPNEEILIKEGLLIRPRTNVYGEFDGKAIAEITAAAQAQQFSELEKASPNFWCMTGAAPEALAHTPALTAGRSILIELVGALPLPPDMRPIEDLLEFRLKRTAELARVRHAIDEIYLKVSSSSDPQIAMQIAVVEIDKSIADLTKSSREWWKTIKLSDSKSLIGFGAAVGGPLIAGASISMPTLGAIAGAAGAVINIGAGINSRLKSNRASPFWYAVQVKKDLI